jgi:tetratricopeptide (TPR) repeat protein
MTYRLASLVLVCLFCAATITAEKSAWVEVRSPNFIVVGNDGQKGAEKVAVQFEEIRAIFRAAMPFASKEQNPVITILAVKDEKSLREILPEYWAKGRAHPAGLFLTRMNKNFIVLRTDIEGPDALEPIYHEYFHSITMPYFPNLPLWVAEGLADFYGNTVISGKDASLGRPDGGLIMQLREGRLIPLEVLFAVDQSSPYYNEQNKTTLYYAESWAVIHYLMEGDKASHRPQLSKYLDLSSQGVSSVDAARQAFGDLKQFQDRISSYISSSAYYSLAMKNIPDIGDKNFPSRPVSAAEADAIRGDYEVYRHSDELANTWISQAEREDPKLALPHESLGMLNFFRGQREDALKEMSKAVELDPKNAMSRYYRAYLTFQPGNPDYLGDQVGADLRQSIAIDPNFPPAYATLASYLAERDEKLDEALAFAKKAQGMERGNPRFVVTVGEVLLRLGRRDDAVKVATVAVKMARNPSERAMASGFLSFAQIVQRQGGVNGSVRFAVRASTPDGDSGDTPPPSVTVDGTSSANVEDAGGDTGTGDRAPADPKAASTPTATGATSSGAPPNGVRLVIKTKKPPADASAPPPNGNGSPKTGGSSAGADTKPGASSAPASPSTPSPATAPGASGKAGGDAAKHSDAKPPLGSRDSDAASYMDEGRVVKATCEGNKLKVVLDIGGLSLFLSANDYTKIKIAPPPKTASEFHVCTQLTGRKARVVYATNTEAGIDGILFEVDAE